MARSVLLLFWAAWLGPVACKNAASDSQEALNLRVTQPFRTDVELSKSFVAQIRAIRHIDLRPIEQGYVQAVFVDEGQQVAKGTKLFQILPSIYQAEVQKAQAEADLRQIEYDNTQVLAKQKVVSPGELAIARAKANRAQAEVKLEATRRSMTEIHAPFDGLVGRFNVRQGSLVDEQDLLTTLSDNSTMWVYFNVSEAEYIDYKSRSGEERARPVQLLLANGQAYAHPGKVDTIEADFNNATGSVAFRAAFANPEGLLRHGETGRVVMTTPLKQALLIPQRATFDVLERKFVFVVGENGVLVSRPITVATELPQVFVVKSGVTERETILIDGLRRVQDGARIRPQNLRPEEVYNKLDMVAE